MTYFVETSPEAMGVKRSALKNLIKELDAFHGVHSVQVLRGGKLVAKADWAPYQPEQPHLMFSVTKTFTAIAIGLLIAEGKLSLNDRVIDLLPDAAPAKLSRKLQKMTVWHLLTMTTGHVTAPNVGGRDWAKSFMRHPVKAEPGSHFIYNTPASHMLSVILTKITGETLFDYLKPRLFKPLGIPLTGQHAATWSSDPRGNNTGGFGLALRPEDLAKLGQLLLQGGKWKRKQLVPATWVGAMMSRQVDSSTQGWGPNSAAGYGYQMWRCPVDAARADGAFGQFAIVWPEHDAIIATTSGVAHDGPHSNYALLDAIYKTMDKAFGPVPDGDATDGEPLVEQLSLPIPGGVATSGIMDKISGVPYLIDGTTDTITVTQIGGQLELAYSHKPASTHVAAYGDWQHYFAPGPDGSTQPAAASYAWANDHTLIVQTYGTAVPFGWTNTLEWNHDLTEVAVAVDQNVSFGDTSVLRATAKKAG